MSFKDKSDTRSSHLSLTALSLIGLCLPVTAGLFSISEDLILLFVGDKYSQSILLLRLLSVLISIYTINNFWSMQVVFSHRGDRSLIKANTIGIVLMLVFCFGLIPRYKDLGATLSTLLTHLILFFVHFSFGRKFYQMKGIKLDILKTIAASLIMTFSIFWYQANSFFELGLKVLGGVCIYFLMLFLLRHSLLLKHLKFKKN